ncbi:hypothetical protein V6N13_034886 [Hibiscus sabdariffa]
MRYRIIFGLLPNACRGITGEVWSTGPISGYLKNLCHRSPLTDPVGSVRSVRVNAFLSLCARGSEWRVFRRTSNKAFGLKRSLREAQVRRQVVLTESPRGKAQEKELSLRVRSSRLKGEGLQESSVRKERGKRESHAFKQKAKIQVSSKGRPRDDVLLLYFSLEVGAANSVA